MTILKIKRSTVAGTNLTVPANSDLSQGELGYTYNGNNLYIGNETSGAPILINTVKTVNSVSPVSGNITLAASDVGAQPVDTDLTALAGLSTTGMLVRTGSGTATTRTITGTAGDITVLNGDGVAGNPTLDLVSVGTPVSASFVKITTDAKGRVTATTAVTTSDITSLVDATYVNVSGDTMTGFLTLSADPTTNLHAATKGYVDAVAAGLSWKTSVKAASTGNLTLSGEQTVDTIALVTGQRVLVKNQTAAKENGIYIVDSGAWTRATDMDSTTPINEINGAAVFVEQGPANGGKGYTQIDQVSVLDTDPIAWAVFSSTTAGVGSVSGTTNRITSTGGTSPVIDISAAYVGQASITTLGNITTGTWDGGYVHSTGTVTGTNLSGTNTGDQTITLTGDVTGSGTGSFATTLATVNSNVGTFAAVTVNAKGLVTAATTLTGDVTSSGAATTLATVNSNVGSFGSSTSIPSFTVNAKGLITAASGNAVVAPAGTLTGTTLNATVVSSSLTSVGTITTGVWNGTTIAIANGGTGQTTANAAFNALAPSQSGNAGYFLTTDATNTSWTNTIDGGSF